MCQFEQTQIWTKISSIASLVTILLTLITLIVNFVILHHTFARRIKVKPYQHEAMRSVLNNPIKCYGVSIHNTCYQVIKIASWGVEYYNGNETIRKFINENEGAPISNIRLPYELYPNNTIELYKDLDFWLCLKEALSKQGVDIKRKKRLEFIVVDSGGKITRAKTKWPI